MIILSGHPHLPSSRPTIKTDDVPIATAVGFIFATTKKIVSAHFLGRGLFSTRAGHTSGVRSDQFTAITPVILSL